MSEPTRILLTAFEPSGDALGAALVAELKRREPDCQVHGMGGPKMREAGVELIEETTQDSAMGVEAVKHLMIHRRRLQKLATWLGEHNIDAAIPTDSPAANWSVCKLVRKHRPAAKIIHLAGPQMWAWAPWRVKKMRRLSDHVLCLLPFEPAWFGERGVPGTFVGHPLFRDVEQLGVDGAAKLPQGDGPRLALLPGSRASEVKGNWPLMLDAVSRIRHAQPGLRVIVAASDDDRAAQLRSMTPDWPDEIDVVVGDASGVVRWADAAIVTSGTATLHTAAIGTPLVVVYRVKRLAWYMVGQFLIGTRTFALPNLVLKGLGREPVVPEFVPHFNRAEAVAETVGQLLADPATAAAQVEAFAALRKTFQQQDFARDACDAVQRLLNTH